MAKYSRFYVKTKDYYEKIAIWDCETEPIMSDCDERCEGKLVFSVIFDGENFFRYRHNDVDKIKKKFKELSDKGYKIVIHNAEFDLLRIYDNLITDSDRYLHNSRFLMCEIEGVTFVDSMNLFLMRLSEVAKMFNMEKFDSDYAYKIGMDIKEKDWEYCEQDCRIVYNAINGFREQLHLLYPGAPVCMTLASTALNLLILELSENKVGFWASRKGKVTNQYLIQTDELLHEMAIESYMGGMTRAVEFGEFEDMVLYDISSSYPYAMTKPFPVPKYSTVTDNPSEEVLANILKYLEGFARCNLRCTCKKPFVPYRYKNKLYYPSAQPFQRVITFPELRKLREIGGYDIEVLQTIHTQRMESPFWKFIVPLYAKKQSAKKEGNLGLAFTAKILLNSSYGKFAQKNRDEEYIPDVDKWLGEGGNDDELRVIGDNIGYSLTDLEYAPHAVLCWASYITGRARARLWPHIQDSVYCDTDSVIVSKEYDIPTGHELGDWEHECDINRVAIHGKKWYMYEKKDSLDKVIVKIKGVGVKKDEDGYAQRKDDSYYNYDNYPIENPPESWVMTKSKTALRRHIDAGVFVKIKKKLNINQDEIIPYEDEELLDFDWVDEEEKKAIMQSLIDNERKYEERDTLDYFFEKRRKQKAREELGDLYDENLEVEENLGKTETEDIVHNRN